MIINFYFASSPTPYLLDKVIIIIIMTEAEVANGGKSVIMVTGGSGLVGAAIKDYIDQTGAKEGETWVFLNSKMGDLRKREDCDKIFEEYKPTHVIHLAAKVGGLFANMAQKV